MLNREAAAGEDLVLVVDDDDGHRAVTSYLMDELCQHSGCRFQAVGSAESALDVALRSKPHRLLVLTDWRMPGMNGRELLVELEKRAQGTSVSGVLFTGIASEDQRIAAGEYPLHEKPHMVDDYERLLRRIVLGWSTAIAA